MWLLDKPFVVSQMLAYFLQILFKLAQCFLYYKQYCIFCLEERGQLYCKRELIGKKSARKDLRSCLLLWHFYLDDRISGLPFFKARYFDFQISHVDCCIILNWFFTYPAQMGCQNVLCLYSFGCELPSCNLYSILLIQKCSFMYIDNVLFLVVAVVTDV